MESQTLQHEWVPNFAEWWPLLTMLTLLAAAGAILLVRQHLSGLSARKWWTLFLFRMALFATLIVALLDWSRHVHVVTRPELLVALDVSSSSLHIDYGKDSQTRLERFKSSLQRLFQNHRQLLQRCQTRFYLIGESTRPYDIHEGNVETALAELQADDAESRIGDALIQLASSQAGRPTAGIVLFSDGVVTEGKSLRDAGRSLRRQEVPVFCVAPRQEDQPLDLALVDLTMNRVVFPDEPTTITFSIQSSQPFEQDHRIDLHVTRKDTNSDLLLSSERVSFPSRDQLTHTVSLTTQFETPGEFHLTARIVDRDFSNKKAGEIDYNKTNNALTIPFQVIDRPLRVLVAQDYPSYEFRFLKDLLQRQPASRFDFSYFLQQGDSRISQIDAAASSVFPGTLEALLEFDLIVLGDVGQNALGSAHGLLEKDLFNLVRYVDAGGSMVMLAGPKHLPGTFFNSPLAPLIPLLPADQLKYQTGNGAIEFACAQGVPDSLFPDNLQSLFPITTLRHEPHLVQGKLKPNALSLVRAETGPASLPWLISMRFGGGVIWFHANASTYLWNFRSSAARAESYWLQAIQRLGLWSITNRQFPVRVWTDRTVFLPGEPIEIQVEYRHPDHIPAAQSTPIQIVSESGIRDQIVVSPVDGSATRFRGNHRLTQPGVYRVEVVDATGDIHGCELIVQNPDRESEAICNETEMSQLAAESGGTFTELGRSDSIWSTIPSEPILIPAPTPPQSLWLHWIWPAIIACTFLSILCGEWVLRRRWGLA